MTRESPFWDAIEGRVPPPPAMAGELLDDSGQIVAAATATAAIHAAQP